MLDAYSSRSLESLYLRLCSPASSKKEGSFQSQSLVAAVVVVEVQGFQQKPKVLTAAGGAAVEASPAKYGITCQKRRPYGASTQNNKRRSTPYGTRKIRQGFGNSPFTAKHASQYAVTCASPAELMAVSAECAFTMPSIKSVMGG